MSNPYAPPPRGSDGRRAPDGAQAPDEAPRRPDGSARPGTALEPSARPGGARPLTGGPGPARGRPPQDPERIAAANRQVMAFGLVMLGTYIALQLPLPWTIAALVGAVASLVLGIRALIAVRRAGARGLPVVVLWVVLVMAALLALSVVVMLLTWPVHMEHQTCLRDALTISAQERCAESLQQDLEEFWSPGIGTQPTGP